MIIGKPGVNSIKELKGQKVGVEVTLVEHLLLLKALEANGMKQSDVELVNTPTNETPQTLASGKGRRDRRVVSRFRAGLKAVAGSKPLFTSAEAKGLIYDVLAVSPTSFAKREDRLGESREGLLPRVDYIMDDKRARKSREDHGGQGRRHAGGVSESACRAAITSRSTEAKKAYKKGTGLDSIYGSMAVGNKFNLDNKVYKVSQKPESYLAPGIVTGLK